jgi:hypothetical protein
MQSAWPQEREAMSTITYLVGSILFPKLVMDNRVRELKVRMRLLAALGALVLVGGVAVLTLHVSHNQGRSVPVGTPFKR